ncbi:hypothetical protein GUJ93_ZPchr0004g40314 [Zizania palustris]|uniref:Uncharacterized protein n=1 Tax=Zizania palustris TaxID=103762 RepID=A0A8J5S0I0_ZIZPA|nr:hypothetical protein GUJ93_ZPchr0004g40314 [Zizania palustris]
MVGHAMAVAGGRGGGTPEAGGGRQRQIRPPWLRVREGRRRSSAEGGRQRRSRPRRLRSRAEGDRRRRILAGVGWRRQIRLPSFGSGRREDGGARSDRPGVGSG